MTTSKCNIYSTSITCLSSNFGALNGLFRSSAGNGHCLNHGVLDFISTVWLRSNLTMNRKWIIDIKCVLLSLRTDIAQLISVRGKLKWPIRLTFNLIGLLLRTIDAYEHICAIPIERYEYGIRLDFHVKSRVQIWNSCANEKAKKG